MEEAEIVSIICEHLQNENWRLWIDDHPIHKDLKFQKHSILIGGARPDIYGQTNFNQIFAIEVKGLKDYKKAIGQALTYKSGVNLSYIGGVDSKMGKIKNIALSSGLGLIFVNEINENVKIQEPLYNIYPQYFEDIKNEIDILKIQKKNNRSFSSFGRTHLLNYFAPVFLFDNEKYKNKKSKQDLLNDFKTAQWRNKTYSEFISGANVIGLLDLSENSYKLSKTGQFCLEYFKSLGATSLLDLQEILDLTSRQNSIYSEKPHLAKFLQLIYFQNPDFKKFISILLSFEKNSISFKEIIDKLILEFPNLFINFFVKASAKANVIEIILSGKKEELMEDYNKTISDYGHYNFIFAFKRHLVHLGILSKENTTFYGKSEDYEAKKDIWILGKDILI